MVDATRAFVFVCVCVVACSRCDIDVEGRVCVVLCGSCGLSLIVVTLQMKTHEFRNRPNCTSTFLGLFWVCVATKGLTSRRWLEPQPSFQFSARHTAQVQQCVVVSRN